MSTKRPALGNALSTGSRFARLESLFHLLVDLDPDRRGAELEALRREDPVLARTLIGLLDEADGDEGLFDPADPTVQTVVELPFDVGPYRLVEQLGEGGMGEVFAAEQREPIKRRVALKLVRSGLAAASVLRRFELERQTLARMNHPGIAGVFDAGVAPDGRPFVVMELVDGLPVTDYADDRRMSTRDRLALFVEICDAVQHAHTKGVIHRDLKPSNILVEDPDGKPRPRVIDFGIAKAVEAGAGDGDRLTRMGDVVGTLEYMSPEQAAGDPRVDATADVYSLGSVLFELLVGEVPHPTRDATLDEALRMVRERPTPRPSSRVTGPATGDRSDRRATDPQSLGRQLKGDLDWIVLKTLAKEPERRYQTVLELAQDIRAHLDGRPVSARPDTVGYRLGKFIERHTAAVVVAMLAAAALVGATIVSTVLYLRADVALVEAETQRATAEQVSAFLQSILEEADPVVTQQRDAITVRDALAHAAGRIDDELADQPEVAATLHRTVARAYEGLSSFADAEHHRRRVVEIARVSFVEAPEKIVGALVDLAGFLLSQEGAIEAEELLDEAQKRAAVLPDERRLWQARIAFQRSLVQEAQNDFDGAEASVRSAVDAFADAGLRDEEGGARGRLGVTLSRQGRYEEAAKELRAKLDIWSATRGAEHSSVARAMNDLAWVLMKLERHDEAIELQESALDGLEAIYGPDHPEVAIAADNLAGVYRSRGRVDEALDLQERALGIFRSQLGPDHVNVAHCLNNIGVTMRVAGDYAAAAERYRQAAAVYARAVGEDHLWMMAARYNIADSLRLAGEHDAAERECREVLELRRRHLRPGHPDIARSLHLLGQLHMDVGEYAEAVPLIEEALAIRLEALPEGHIQITSAENDLETCRRILAG